MHAASLQVATIVLTTVTNYRSRTVEKDAT
jgi:hypothetical protein